MPEVRSRVATGVPATVLLAALLFALVPAGSAAADTHLMVLNRSMAGVRVGDSLARLHQVLGEPRAIEHEANEITGSMRIDVYGKLSFSSYGSSILAMKTTRRSIRTRSGIGVGTTKRRLERRFPGLSCYGRTCTIVAGGGVATIGKTVTSFRVRHGVVRFVVIGRVID